MTSLKVLNDASINIEPYTMVAEKGIELNIPKVYKPASIRINFWKMSC